MQENLAAVLPDLQRTISILHDRECMSLGIPTADVQCVVDTSVSTVLVQAGEIPTIRISASWALLCVIEEKTELIIIALRRAIMIAYHKLRWSIGNKRVRKIAEYVEKARMFRLASDATTMPFSLPVKNFRVRYSITMYDPMTEETEFRELVRADELEYVEREMATLLTAKVYSHEQAANLLDLLHAHKLSQKDPPVISEVSIQQISESHTIETLSYEVPE
jgi:hypothetical protein